MVRSLSKAVKKGPLGPFLNQTESVRAALRGTQTSLRTYKLGFEA